LKRTDLDDFVSGYVAPSGDLKVTPFRVYIENLKKLDKRDDV